MIPKTATSEDPFDAWVRSKKTTATQTDVVEGDPFRQYAPKKKEQSNPFGQKLPIPDFQFTSESVSESTEPVTEPTTESPTGFLEKDIEQSQFFSTPDIPSFDPRSLSEPETPQVQNSLLQEDKAAEMQKILTEPDALSSYAKDRVNKIKSEIQKLQNVDLERFAEYGATSVPGAPLSKTFKPGAEVVQQQIEEKKRYLNKFQSALADQAAFVVGASEDLTTVDDAKLKSIGAKYLKTMNNTGIASDEEVLRTIDDIGANKTDIDRTSQNINYKLYKAGADVMAKYYNDVADKTFQEAKPKLQELNSLLQQKDTMKPGLDADLLQSSINDLMQDPQVKSYIDSERNAATYLKKSNDAINEFPQVKRQAMRQQLNDAFFNMTVAKQSASKDVGSLGMALGSWLFGEEATEGDVKSLAKATGIPEDQVNEIIGTDIKGWFGSAKDAGIRIPGALVGLAQSTDETIAKSVMGAKRFFNTENVEAENRLLSDRVQDYNLKAQKAKLFDDAGKLNFNPYSVFNTMGSGIGQTAVYAAPSLLTGGLAANISGIDKIGKLVSMATTTGTGFVGSYEDAYKEAKQYTTDEDVARSYATKVGLVNGLSEIFLEPADVAKKLAIGSPRGKDAFSAFSKMYKEKGAGAAMAQGLKEFGKVVGTENVEELSALLGETKFKESELGVQTSPAEFINQAIETAVTTTLTTLPLGVGAGMNANRDVSSIRKQALFEAGNEPDLYRDRLRTLLDNGTIDQKHYNDRVAVVNTMSGIVANINQSETQTGKKLSYDQKANLAAQQFRIDLDNKRLKSNGVLEAEKPLIEADIKEATEIQRQELEDIPEDMPSTEQQLKEVQQGDVVTFTYDDESKVPDVFKDKISSIGETNGVKKINVTVPKSLADFELNRAATPEAVVSEVTVNEREQAAIEGLQNKDFTNSPVKPYTDVIQNPDASIADKKEALKGLSDQLTARGTEIIVGEALGKEADLIYDLGYEPAQESEAIREVTEEGRSKVQASEPTPVPVKEESVSSNSNEGINPALKDVESTTKALSAIEPSISEKLSNKIGETLNKKKAKIDTENNSAITSAGKQIKFRIAKSTDTEIGQDFLTISAIDNNGNKVGYAKFLDNGNKELEGSEVEVPEKQQKQGIASAIYSYADAMGYKVKESVLQTPEGRSLWKSLKAKEGSLKSISEAYHKAKLDSSNPELVKAVEEALSKPNTNESTPTTEVSPKVGVSSNSNEVPKANTEEPSVEEEVIELTDKEKLASEKSLPSYRAKYPGATQEEYQANRVSGTRKKDRIKDMVVTTANWRDHFEKTKDKSRKSDILRAIADLNTTDDKELSEILDKVVGLPDESNIAWAVANNPKSSIETFDKAVPLFEGSTTEENIKNIRNNKFGESPIVPKEATKKEEPKPKKKSKSKKKLTSIEDVENELRDLFAMDRMVGIPVGEKTNTIEQYLEKAKAVLSQLYPDATITTYDTAEEYYDKESRPVGSMGVFHPKENRLALNLELISKNGAANTVFHEVIHPIVEEAIVSKEGALDEAWNQLMELKDAPGMMSVFEHMLAYEGRSINVQRVEGITEFITQVAEGNIDVSDMPKSLATKIIELINEIFEKLGIDKRLSTANDLAVLSKAVKNAFETADASSVATALGNRSNLSGESMDALSGAEQEAAIKDLISRSEGIPQDKLKAAIKKYTGWSDEKIDSLFAIKGAPGSEIGERKFTTRVAEDEGIQEPTRRQIKENLEYVRRANAISAKEASDILSNLGEEESYDIVVNDRDIAPATRVVLGQALIKKFNQLAVNSKDPEEKERYHQRTVNIADFVAERLGTIPGQMIQALSLYSRLTPEAQIMKAVKEKKKDSQYKKDKAERKATGISDKIRKVNAETADEITSSNKISKAVNNAKKSISDKAAEKIERARKRRQQIKDKYKSERGTSLYSGVGLTKEGIEYVGNIAKTYIDEGIAELSIIIDNVINDLKELTGKAPNEEAIKNVNDIVFSQFQSRKDDIISKNLKDLEATVGRIIKEHYTVKEAEKRSLVDKFVESAGLPHEEAKKLADEVSEEFDRIATRKKTAILDQEKKQFNQIKKILDTWNKTSAERLANDIIKYTNLGAFDRGDLIDMLAKKIGTGQLTPEEIKKIRELAERVEKAPEGSPKTKATEDLLAYQADLKGTSWAEVGQAIWYANVLSGVSTHLKNIISTFFNGAAYFATQSVRDPRSIPFLFKGGVSGAKRGFFEAIHTATTGETPIHVRAIDVPDVLERKSFYGGIFNPVNYLKYVTRMMKAEDVLQFQALKEMRATQLAYKEARKLGYKNSFSNSTWRKVDELLLNTKERIDEATKTAQEEGLSGAKLDRRVYELMELSRPIQMTEDAYGFAAKGTFNHDTDGTLGALNDLASRMLDFSVGGAKPLRFIVPFTRILTNVLNNAIDFSPLGLVRAARGVRGFKSFGKSIEDKYHVMTPDERADTLAKASLATALTLGLYVLTKMKGDDDEPFLEITGGGTGDYRKDAQLRQSGWQPYSVKIGDNYYSYALTPLAISLGLVGNINDHEKYSKGADEEELYQKVTLAAFQWAKLATDMTWISSTASFMGAWDSDSPKTMAGNVSRQMANTSKSFLVPNIYSQTAQEYQRLFSLPQKQANNFYEQLIQDVPIARNSLNDKINALGDPIIRDTDLMISEKTVDPTLKLLMDKKAWVSPVNKNSFIVYDKEKKLERVGSDDEYYRFSKIRGRKIKEGINEAVNRGVPFSADGRVTISDNNIVQYRPLKDVTSSQFQSYIRSISGAATKAAKSELTFDKPKN